MLATCLALLPVLPPASLPAQDTPEAAGPDEEQKAAAAVPAEALLIQAERVIVRPGVELENVSIVVQDGQILDVGREVEVFAEETRILNAPLVCAGFLDPWSVLGLTGDSVSEESSSASTSSVDAIDRHGQRHLLEEALRAGVTSVRTQVGPKARVGGVGAVLRTAPDLDRDESMLLADACVQLTAGVTRRGRPVDVFDRVTEVDRVISAIEAGRAYREGWITYRKQLEEWETAIAEKVEELEKDFKKAKKDRDKEIEEAEEKGKEFKEERYKEDKKPKPPRFNAEDEVLARVANGEVPLVVEVHRATEIRRLLTATEKFKRLRLVIAGGTEAAALADELADRRVPVIVWPAPLGSARPPEAQNHDLSLAATLHEAGVEVLLGSGGTDPAASRDLPLLAALSVGFGLDRDAAFHALTLGAAGALDVADRVGSVERGKDADLLLLDGEPLAGTTRILGVISKGHVVVEP
jgi:imidazolonepropionase-like amidohydrolase